MSTLTILASTPIVEKNLGAVEDLLLGDGQVQQTRNGQQVTVTRFGARSIPWAGTPGQPDFVSMRDYVESVIATGGAIDDSNITTYTTYSSSKVEAELAATVRKDSNTGSAVLPAGTTAERTVNAVDGAIRLNTELSRFEGYNAGFWGNLFESNGLFYENTNTITSSYTVPEGKNAMTAGPISIANSAEVTVSNGSVWTVV